MEGRFPCPVDERGLPLIPIDFNVCYDVCLKGIKHTNWHHLLHPRNAYKTPKERLARNASSAIVEACVCKHADYHNTYKPPHKPSHQTLTELAQGDIAPQEQLVYIRERNEAIEC